MPLLVSNPDFKVAFGIVKKDTGTIKVKNSPGWMTALNDRSIFHRCKIQPIFRSIL